MLRPSVVLAVSAVLSGVRADNILSTSTSTSVQTSNSTALVDLVNLFIGTASGANGGSGGNAFPGAAIPHAMVKVGIDVSTAPRQAGYIHDNSTITGVSLLHDEGTGGNTNGGYGNFPLFPLAGCVLEDFEATGSADAGCRVGIAQRAALRANGSDQASPGYFSTMFVDGRKIEVTSTRRAGLMRFTFPEDDSDASTNSNSTSVSSTNAIVIDLTNDLGRSFEGGSLGITSIPTSSNSASNSTSIRVTLGGTYLQSYGPGNYTVFGCYDFADPGLLGFGTYQTESGNAASFEFNTTLFNSSSSPSAEKDLEFPFMGVVLPVQAGAFVLFDNSRESNDTDPNTVLVRFGVSFISPEQACLNAEAEVPDLSESTTVFASSGIAEVGVRVRAGASSGRDVEIVRDVRDVGDESSPRWDFDALVDASRRQWEQVLGRVRVDTEKEDGVVVELLYSSLYRASLVPANLTGENPYWSGGEPFFDALFCSWDTFRTVHPLLSLTSPVEWAQIVRAYVNGWRHGGDGVHGDGVNGNGTGSGDGGGGGSGVFDSGSGKKGFIPECRANTKAGYVQGGSNGMPILGDWAVKYGVLDDGTGMVMGVSLDDLYQALVDTAENTPPDWYTVGRQNTAWKTFGYIPTDWVDPAGSTGLATREVSRGVEYAFNDFAVRQAALALNKSSSNGDGVGDAQKYANRSMNFVNYWNPNVSSDGFEGFAQRRYQNGSFAFTSPDACSPVDPVSHSCARGDDNDTGFYESSSWEMSFFAPHSVATLIRLMGGSATFVERVNNYFSKGYFQAGNEPSFAIPSIYHYAGRPDLSALRIRNVVYEDFGVGIGGIPGNDDSGAMASLLTFHLLGLYPIPASTQFLLGSPFVSSYTLTNEVFGSSNSTDGSIGGTKFTVLNFDPETLTATPPNGSRLFVKSVSVNGETRGSVCVLEFADIVGGGEVVIEVDGDAEAAAERGCAGPGTEAGGGLPDSLESGGFAR